MATANKPMDVLIGNCSNIVTIVPQLSCRTPRTSRGARKFSATGKVRQLRRTDRFGRSQRHRCSPAEAVSASNGRWSSASRSPLGVRAERSEEHTSELQSLMRISYAVFCLKKKNYNNKLTKNLYY